jgi:hypothetical protein
MENDGDGIRWKESPTSSVPVTAVGPQDDNQQLKRKPKKYDPDEVREFMLKKVAEMKKKRKEEKDSESAKNKLIQDRLSNLRDFRMKQRDVVALQTAAKRAKMHQQHQQQEEQYQHQQQQHHYQTLDEYQSYYQYQQQPEQIQQEYMSQQQTEIGKYQLESQLASSQTQQQSLAASVYATSEISQLPTSSLSVQVKYAAYEITPMDIDTDQQHQPLVKIVRPQSVAGSETTPQSSARVSPNRFIHEPSEPSAPPSPAKSSPIRRVQSEPTGLSNTHRADSSEPQIFSISKPPNHESVLHSVRQSPRTSRTPPPPQPPISLPNSIAALRLHAILAAAQEIDARLQQHQHYLHDDDTSSTISDVSVSTTASTRHRRSRIINESYPSAIPPQPVPSPSRQRMSSPTPSSRRSSFDGEIGVGSLAEFRNRRLRREKSQTRSFLESEKAERAAVVIQRFYRNTKEKRDARMLDGEKECDEEDEEVVEVTRHRMVKVTDDVDVKVQYLADDGNVPSVRFGERMQSERQQHVPWDMEESNKVPLPFESEVDPYNVLNVYERWVFSSAPRGEKSHKKSPAVMSPTKQPAQVDVVPSPMDILAKNITQRVTTIIPSVEAILPEAVDPPIAVPDLATAEKDVLKAVVPDSKASTSPPSASSAAFETAKSGITVEATSGQYTSEFESLSSRPSATMRKDGTVTTISEHISEEIVTAEEASLDLTTEKVIKKADADLLKVTPEIKPKLSSVDFKVSSAVQTEEPPEAKATQTSYTTSSYESADTSSSYSEYSGSSVYSSDTERPKNKKSHRRGMIL